MPFKLSTVLEVFGPRIANRAGRLGKIFRITGGVNRTEMSTLSPNGKNDRRKSASYGVLTKSDHIGWSLAAVTPLLIFPGRHFGTQQPMQIKFMQFKECLREIESAMGQETRLHDCGRSPDQHFGRQAGMNILEGTFPGTG